MGAFVIGRVPWRRGAVRAPAGPVVISATKATYGRLRDLLLVDLYALRMRRRWSARPGSVALLLAGDAATHTGYTISVWESETDLRRFLAAPDHVPLMRRFRPRLRSIAATTWVADDFYRAAIFREALQRLNEPHPETRIRDYGAAPH